ncbi:hypothetical protein IFR05_009733 [Cadophora sp. M221]|nr:hypothetical protein IFR05_009733 [Cadophora sp. M221]
MTKSKGLFHYLPIQQSSCQSTKPFSSSVQHIGASLAHHIHAQGKTVIATGRRQDRLSALASSHPGLQTSSFDFSDISTLPSNLSALTENYPSIDTVIITAAVQSFFKFSDAETPSLKAIDLY